MKKSAQDRLNASLDKALAAPRQKPKQNLDALLDEYDDHVDASSIPIGILTAIPAAIPTTSPQATDPRRTVAKEPDEQTAPLDATHTSAERSVYSIMYRETISKGSNERHFGPAELMKKTGIRSRNTVHKALYGLVEKLSVEVVAEASGNPLGPRYRVHKPQTIEQRRRAADIKIDLQTKRITERAGIPTSIPTASPATITNNRDTTDVEIGIPTSPISGMVIKYRNEDLAASPSAAASSSNLTAQTDDEAARLIERLQTIEREVTGKAGSLAKWHELLDLLIVELQIAAARTGQVSNVPAFLTEHLRRRLWKKDKAQLEAESREAASTPEAKRRVDASKCPDCGGSGWWYPAGTEKGVAKCRHKELNIAPDA